MVLNRILTVTVLFYCAFRVFCDNSDDRKILTHKSKKNCTCVPYYLCSDDAGQLITDGRGLIDLRILENSQCQGYVDVCCNKTNVSFSANYTQPKLHGCGYQYSGFFPWHAALFYKEANEYPQSYKCGVSLIHEKVVITAAHCIIKETSLMTIKIGNMIRQVQSVIGHSKYNPQTLQNDIALIILRDPVKLSENINTICIPPEGSMLDNMGCRYSANRVFVKKTPTNDETKPYVATTNIVSTKVKNKEGSFLKMLNLSIISRNKCLDMLRSTRLGPFFQLHHSFLCVSGMKKTKDGVCGGDGGSPLVCPVPGQPGRFHQAGIVSWGIGCGEMNVPDVYVKLPVFREWIDKEMIKNGFGITSYRY